MTRTRVRERKVQVFKRKKGKKKKIDLQSTRIGGFFERISMVDPSSA